MEATTPGVLFKLQEVWGFWFRALSKQVIHKPNRVTVSILSRSGQGF